MGTSYTYVSQNNQVTTSLVFNLKKVQVNLALNGTSLKTRVLLCFLYPTKPQSHLHTCELKVKDTKYSQQEYKVERERERERERELSLLVRGPALNLLVAIFAQQNIAEKRKTLGGHTKAEKAIKEVSVADHPG